MVEVTKKLGDNMGWTVGTVGTDGVGGNEGTVRGWHGGFFMALFRVSSISVLFRYRQWAWGGCL
jgi:hypothetical protein